MKKIPVYAPAASALGRCDWGLGLAHVHTRCTHTHSPCRPHHVTSRRRPSGSDWRGVASCMSVVSPIVARKPPPAGATVFCVPLPNSHRGLACTTFDRLAIHLAERFATRPRILSQTGSPWHPAPCGLHACRRPCCITGPAKCSPHLRRESPPAGVGVMLPPCVRARRVARPPTGLGGHGQHSHGSLTRRLLQSDRLCSAAALVISPADRNVITRAAHNRPLGGVVHANAAVTKHPTPPSGSVAARTYSDTVANCELVSSRAWRQLAWNASAGWPACKLCRGRLPPRSRWGPPCGSHDAVARATAAAVRQLVVVWHCRTADRGMRWLELHPAYSCVDRPRVVWYVHVSKRTGTMPTRKG